MVDKHSADKTDIPVSVRQLRESDVPEADRICRSAFNTFTGAPDLFGDKDYVIHRQRALPDAALAAEVDGELVGSNFAASWGSVGFFGPLTVRPELWDRGIAKALMESTMDTFTAWGTEHAGLFTFPQSPKHIGLYQKFGFWPRFLTPIMSKLVQGGRTEGWSTLSRVADVERYSYVSACRELTAAVYDGLDLEPEIRAVEAQQLGETVVLPGDKGLLGMAVCHIGAGSEAGSGSLYVKFAAVRPGPTAGADFDKLLDAVETLAEEKGVSRVEAGVNTGRDEAYRTMLSRGYRADWVGMTMHRPNQPGYSRPGSFVIDDWR